MEFTKWLQYVYNKMLSHVCTQNFINYIQPQGQHLGAVYNLFDFNLLALEFYIYILAHTVCKM